MSKRAFTLIEVMVVAVIIAVLAAMALPSFLGSLGAASLRSSADGLCDTAQYLRRMAVTRQRTYRLVLTDGSSREQPPGYQVEVAGTDIDAAATFETVKEGAIKPTKLAAPVRFAELLIDNGQAGSRNPSQRAITFRPDGTADAAVIQLTNGRRVISILIEPNLGRVWQTDGAIRALPNEREDLDA